MIEDKKAPPFDVSSYVHTHTYIYIPIDVRSLPVAHGSKV